MDAPMIKKSKIFLNFFPGLVITLFLLLLLAGCGEGTEIETNLQTVFASETDPFSSPITQSIPSTPALNVTTEPNNTLAATPTPLRGQGTQTQSYLEGTYNCFAQGVPSASGYANTYLFRSDGTWADITYGKQYASNPKYNFAYKLVGSDLSLIYPSGNSSYKVETENNKYKLVQYGDKNNQTCYQKV